MKEGRFVLTALFAGAVFLMSLHSPEGSPGLVDIAHAVDASGIAVRDTGRERMAGDILDDLVESSPTAQALSNLYSRHRLEIERILYENPFMIREGIEILVEALPALKTVPGNGGRLTVDRELYGKASGLLEQLQALSSPELSDDLGRSKILIESRMREHGDGSLVIDLN